MATATKETKESATKAARAAKNGAEAPPPLEIIPWKNEKLPALSAPDAEKFDAAIKNSRVGTALLLYVFMKRKGYEKLKREDVPKVGYASLEEYAEVVHGIKSSTAYETVQRVEMTLKTNGILPSSLNVDVEDLNKVAGTNFRLLPVETVRELRKLEDGTKQQRVFAEAQQVLAKEGEAAVQDSRMLNSTIKSIVKRYLPPVPRTAPTPAAEPAPSAFDTDAAAGQLPLPETTAPPIGEEAAAPEEAPAVRMYLATTAQYNEDADTWEIGFYRDGELEFVEVASSLLEA